MRDRHNVRLFAAGALVASACWLLAVPAFGQLTVTEAVSPTLGMVFGGPPGRQFVLNTDGTVGGANAADYMTGAVGGELILQWRGQPRLVWVVAENIAGTGGLNANSVLCRWQNGPQVACSGAGMIRTLNGRRRLRVGIDLTTTQTHGGGDTAAVAFDITAVVL